MGIKLKITFFSALKIYYDKTLLSKYNHAKFVLFYHSELIILFIILNFKIMLIILFIIHNF